jgi:hypothetical protein
MASKGITMEMLIEAYNEAAKKSNVVVEEKKEEVRE